MKQGRQVRQAGRDRHVEKWLAAIEHAEVKVTMSRKPSYPWHKPLGIEELLDKIESIEDDCLYHRTLDPGYACTCYTSLEELIK